MRTVRWNTRPQRGKTREKIISLLSARTSAEQLHVCRLYVRKPLNLFCRGQTCAACCGTGCVHLHPWRSTTRAQTTRLPMSAAGQDERALLDAVAALRVSHPDSTPKQVHGMLVQEAAEWAAVSISAVKRACCKAANMGLLRPPMPESKLLALTDAVLTLVCESVAAEDAVCFKASSMRLYDIFCQMPSTWGRFGRLEGCPRMPIAGVFRNAQRLAWALDGGFFHWLQRYDGSPDDAKWGIDPRCCLCARAAECGELEDLKLLSASYPWDEGTPLAATVRGRLDMLRFAVEGGCKMSLKGCKKTAAFYGHQSLLRYMADQCDSGSLAGLDRLGDDPGELCALAASGGHLELVKWLRSHGCEWGRTITAAARNGQLAIVKYAVNKNCPLSGEALEPGGFVAAAAESGNVDLVRFAFGHSGGPTTSPSFCSALSMPMFHASRHGNLAMMQFLHDRGFPWDWRMVNEAAQSPPQSPDERLALAQYLHARAEAEDFTTEAEHAVRWEECTWLQVAAGRNELSLIQWVRSLGVELKAVQGADMCAVAASRGHTAVIEYARQHGCPWGEAYEECLQGPLDNDACLEMLQWLNREGAPFRPDIWEWAFIRGHLRSLEWLLSAKCPWGDAFYINRDVPPALLRWAEETGHPVKLLG